MNKFNIECKKCGYITNNFTDWFKSDQKCHECKSNQVAVNYLDDSIKLEDIYKNYDESKGMWNYFNVLPLVNQDNIVSCGEGCPPIEKWEFLENYIKTLGADINIYIQRNDLSKATGTFKDMAGTVVASVLKENNIQEYVVASTGNIASAFSYYLFKAGIKLTAFIPKGSSKLHEAEISSYGHTVLRADGDYEKAKELAAKYAKNNSIPLAAGNFDPMRVEAKKIMVYEWMRQLGFIPDVYIQALSGGTGPLGIIKALDELKSTSLPKFIMVQSEKCAPMADAWKKAKSDNFPDEYEFDYPVYSNPDTKIVTLSTGNPKTYPVLSKVIRESNGDIIDYNEDKVTEVARLISLETGIKVGPAAAISIGALIKSVQEGKIVSGNRVVVNLGESIRRAPDFFENFISKAQIVDDNLDFEQVDKSSLKKNLWENIIS